MRMLLVEDSKRLQELLGETLRDADFQLDIAGTTAEFWALTSIFPYDLFIIDLGLPDGDGLDIIRTVRSKKISTPVLVITARATIDNRIAGLDSGADDYLIKPFNHGELLARVRALLRRPRQVTEAIVHIGGLTLRTQSNDIICDGRALNLRPSERRLLSLLMRKSGTTVSKEQIENVLYEMRRDVSVNAVEVLVSRLRKALTEANAGIDIATIRGEGYLLREASL